MLLISHVFLLAHDLHQLASTSNEYFIIISNFLRSSIGTQYLEIILETSPDHRRSGAWERLGRLYGLITCLMPLSRRVHLIKDVLFNKVNLIPLMNRDLERFSVS